MKIAVIGPGAMGCLFAARLARSGCDVTLVDHKQERAARLNASGILVEGADGTIETKLKVVTNVPNNCELAIVLVKAHSTIHLNLNSRTPLCGAVCHDRTPFRYNSGPGLHAGPYTGHVPGGA